MLHSLWGVCRYSAPPPGNEDIIAVTHKSKVFAAGRGGATIHTFSLKKKKKTRIIDLLDAGLQQ